MRCSPLVVMHCTSRCRNSSAICRPMSRSRKSIAGRIRALDASLRIPIAPSEPAIALHADSVALDAHQRRTGAVGAQQLRAAGTIALDHLLLRMAETVA